MQSSKFSDSFFWYTNFCSLNICFTLCSCRYKLTFYATDGSTEAEMFCFDSIARQIVGKPCEFLLKTVDASQNIPKDLRTIVGLRFTFAVNININLYYSKQRILNVNSVLQAHGREEQRTVSNRDASEALSFDIDDSASFDNRRLPGNSNEKAFDLPRYIFRKCYVIYLEVKYVNSMYDTSNTMIYMYVNIKLRLVDL
jgi:hypothetical protein